MALDELAGAPGGADHGLDQHPTQGAFVLTPAGNTIAPTWGTNKHTRKLIAGQQRMIELHEQKIQEESRKPLPNFGRIRQWQRDIDNGRKRVRELRERLER